MTTTQARSIAGLAILSLASLLAGLLAPVPANAEDRPSGPGGTYTDWWFPDGEGYASLEWTFVPVKDPPESLARKKLLHYYAYNFGLVNSTDKVGRGYAGFQTNGLFKGHFVGKVINFSIWGSNGGESRAGAVNSANKESGGYQIMAAYPWIVGRRYRFRLSRDREDSKGIWWRLTVRDLEASKTTVVGDIRVQADIEGRRADALGTHTSVFGEDLHWWRTWKGAERYSCSDFEPSALATIDVTANGKVRPVRIASNTNNGKIAVADNGFETVSCDAYVYVNGYDTLHKLGYWDARHNRRPLLLRSGAGPETPRKGTRLTQRVGQPGDKRLSSTPHPRPRPFSR